MKKLVFILSIVFLSASCDQLPDVINKLPVGVSNEDNVAGLKSALNVGTGYAVDVLGVTDGFYKDQLVKIPLPEEIQSAINAMQGIPFVSDILNNMVENTVLSLNRSAEDAVKEATPIFVNAITGMTITDGLTILKGGDGAATKYLNNSTYSQLTEAFAPKINTSLDKPLVGSKSTAAIWSNFTTEYNNLINNPLVKHLKLTPIEVDLGKYVTQKALDGLFSKIAVEENKIRNDVNARTSDLLQRVFGQLDKK